MGVSQFETGISTATEFAFATATQGGDGPVVGPVQRDRHGLSPRGQVLSTFGRRAFRCPFAASNLSKQFVTSGHRADQLLLNIVSSDAYRFVEIATK